jgi:hypothetical protein
MQKTSTFVHVNAAMSSQMKEAGKYDKTIALV